MWNTRTLLCSLCCLVSLTTSVDPPRPDDHNSLSPQPESAEMHASSFIHITTPPKLVKSPQLEMAYKEQESVKLPCEAVGTSPITYVWTKDLAPLDIDGIRYQMEGGKGTLHINTLGGDEVEDVDGDYQCYARNQFGRAVSIKALVKKAYIRTFETKDTQILAPFVGSYIKLTCTPPESYPRALVYWGSGLGENYQNVPLSRRVALDYDGSLHFANVIESDGINGEKYTCTVQNYVLRTLAQGDDHILEVKPRAGTPQYQAPNLEWSSPEEVVAVEGEVVKMMCIFSGYPTPEVQWERVGALPGPRTDLESSSGLEMKIINVDNVHAGRYRCTARSDGSAQTVSREFTLRVEYSPRWEEGEEPVDVTASEEEDAKIVCAAHGKPSPDWSFTFNGQTIEGGDVPKDDRMRIIGDTVYFRNLTKTDTQVVQCNVSNVHGYLFNNVYLNVLAEPPYFIEAPAAVTKRAEGQEVILTCRVFGAPRPKITWRRGSNDEEVSGPRFTVLEEGDLRIMPAVKDDAMQYTCHAQNKFGQETKRGMLLIRERTSIDYHPKSQVVQAGTDVVFFCNATTDPDELVHLRISWLKNGDEIDYVKEGKISKNVRDNSMLITKASPADSGSYTCLASNGIDEDQSTAQLTVRDRPDPPTDISLIGCTSSRAQIDWRPGSENNDEVIEFIVKYNTSFDDPGVYHVGAIVRRGQNSAQVPLSPWAHYTFHVLARNSIGVSDPSSFSTSKCETPAKKPTHDPDWVCTSSEDPSQLVIRWKTFPPIMHNGSDFHYVVKYRLASNPTNEAEEKVWDWRQGKLVVENQPIYTRYEISVKTANEKGLSRGGERWKDGFSGEDTPVVTPENFMLDSTSLNATHATFYWDSVDTSMEAVRGFFVGYKIVYWKADDPDNKRTTEVIKNEVPSCPPEGEENNAVSRLRRASTEDGTVGDLWPFSRIGAAIQVMNGGKVGALSDPPIFFDTPEGVPGVVGMFRISERGSHHLKVEWLPPLEPNGILTHYVIGYQEVGEADTIFLPLVDVAHNHKKIHGLSEDTLYQVYIWAHTIKGAGIMMTDEGRTRIAGQPDMPIFGEIETGDSWANVSWAPSEDDDPKNPGSHFYVEYKRPGSDEWERSEVQREHNWVNISGLDQGPMTIRVVAVNARGDETYSDEKNVTIGPQDGESEEIVSPVTSVASAGWFIGIMCALIFLLLILLIVCLIRRNRGGKYPVHEKEKLAGRDPEKEDEEAGFGEYTKNNEPEKKKSRTSLNSEERPLESDTDSMAEYYETDPSKFNEDGSFIGQYGGKKKAEPETTSPSALSTFV